MWWCFKPASNGAALLLALGQDVHQVTSYFGNKEVLYCRPRAILTTNFAAVVCVCAKFDQFLPARSYFESIRPENVVRIAKFPYAAFGPLFAFHCPLFFTRNND